MKLVLCKGFRSWFNQLSVCRKDDIYVKYGVCRSTKASFLGSSCNINHLYWYRLNLLRVILELTSMNYITQVKTISAILNLFKELNFPLHVVIVITFQIPGGTPTIYTLKPNAQFYGWFVHLYKSVFILHNIAPTLYVRCSVTMK